jgi:hypothetical protein
MCSVAHGVETLPFLPPGIHRTVYRVRCAQALKGDTISNFNSRRSICQEYLHLRLVISATIIITADCRIKSDNAIKAQHIDFTHMDPGFPAFSRSPVGLRAMENQNLWLTSILWRDDGG